jgi:hypothetical protein
MRLPPARFRPLLIALVCAGGCTTGEYQKEYESRIRSFRGDSIFAVLAPKPVPIGEEGRVEVRIPRQLGPQGEDNGAKIRGTPPFVRNFPGYSISYEKILSAGTPQLPVVLTLGVVPSSLKRFGEVEREILEQVRGDEAFPKAEWQKGKSIQPGAGGPASWDVLSLKGQQEFESLVGGNPEYKKWPGACEIWVSAEPKQEYCTVMALRVPDDIAAQLELPPEQLAELVASSVRILPPPDDQAADAAEAK